jgi:hypothetical protein
VPTFAEAGFGALTLAGWWGVLLPARAPKPVVAALERSLAEAIAQPETREGITNFEAVSFYEELAALAARIAREAAGWAPIVAASGFRAMCVHPVHRTALRGGFSPCRSVSVARQRLTQMRVSVEWSGALQEEEKHVAHA